ncbi:MAG: dephospho-CoA kinase [Candidatus Edwardsbacteria bacterium]|nr:dephospho-CoA kinase [Candidatus Edwardsbacteria bacterium]MBU1576766.1 dephospho-CoA kinase [Candidatus Edwardsbacteria bacterium]MBU2462484.1 dephospho-CoA kinase [Candidatus Edwardsbacteria bacterium]MBU2595201.1 dephospho-CoA kinase [Candidatus Edwardsbacteria bacterium]
MKENKKHIIIIGLTGGAGSGKSTVARVFRRRGACVIDADKLGHELLNEKLPCFAKIVKGFGSGILSDKKTIDRGRLGERAFSDPAEMSRLNRIVHPALLREIKNRILLCRAKCPARPIVIDAALIVQWGLEKKLDILIMVNSLKKLRLARLQARGISMIKARKIIASQLSVSKTKHKAGIIITNNGTIGQLEKKAARVWNKIFI